MSDRPWQVLAASAAGDRHRSSGLPCQDAFHHARLSPTTLAVIIADGMGSARCGGKGAQTAAQAAGDFLRRQWNEDEATLMDAVRAARTALGSMAENDRIEDYATTLAVAVLSGNVLDAVAVGDSGFVALNEDRELIHPHSNADEFANVTVPVTAPDWERHVRHQRIDRVEALIAATDGVLCRIVDANCAVEEKYPSALFAFARKSGGEPTAAERFQQHVEGLPTGDDRTIVLAWRSLDHDD